MAWLRGSHARRKESTGDIEKKIAAVRVAAKYEFPGGDIESTLAEIEQGYLSGPHPHKNDAQRLVERLLSERSRLVSDAESCGKFCVATHPLIVSMRYNLPTTRC